MLTTRGGGGRGVWVEGGGGYSTTPDSDSLTRCRENMLRIISLRNKAGDVSTCECL